MKVSIEFSVTSNGLVIGYAMNWTMKWMWTHYVIN